MVQPGILAKGIIWMCFALCPFKSFLARSFDKKGDPDKVCARSWFEESSSLLRLRLLSKNWVPACVAAFTRDYTPFVAGSSTSSLFWSIYIIMPYAWLVQLCVFQKMHETLALNGSIVQFVSGLTRWLHLLTMFIDAPGIVCLESRQYKSNSLHIQCS